MHQIITSLLDTDLYKLTMQQAVLDKFDHEVATYAFKDRGDTEYPEGFAHLLRQQVALMGTLRLTDDEAEYLKGTGLFSQSYLNFLRQFKFDANDVVVDQHGGNLQIDIHGPWVNTILWEVPLMRTISALYFRHAYPVSDFLDRARDKAVTIKAARLKVVDFGTRRSFSPGVHRNVVWTMKDALAGTSNPYIAWMYNMPVVGTYAHEWVQAHAGLYGVTRANHMAMFHWTDTYYGKLGIALTDTYTSDKFLESFNWKYARIFDGVRHDSSDPIAWGYKMLQHYRNLGIDPNTKTFVFSDGLDVPTAAAIEANFRGQVNLTYGIGTNLTNDVGAKPLNIVIKLMSIHDTDVVKLSDEPGKASGHPMAVLRAKRDLDLV